MNLKIINMRLVKLLFLLVVISVVSCTSEDEKMQRYLIGNWETVYMNFEFPSYKGKDTLFEYDVDYANPHDPRAQELGKPFTTYKADGTFKRWIEKNRIPSGRPTAGKWRVTKDSLFWSFDQGSGKKDRIVAFGLKEIEDGYAASLIVDQDRDGKADDLIYIETVRLPDTEE